jgi:penicillin amidase
VASREDVQALVSWNHRMSRDQVAPTLFAAWAPAAYRRVMTHELRDQPRAAALLGASTNYAWLEARFAEHAANPNGSPVMDSLLLNALDDATADLVQRFGTDRAKWRWGDIHVAAFRHPLSSRYDLPAVSRGGDGNTVNVTGGANFRQTAGASFREVIDLADFDNSFATNVPGQSGDPRSPHYSDLLRLWGEDQYFPLLYSRAKVVEATRAILVLEPAK